MKKKKKEVNGFSKYSIVNVKRTKCYPHKEKSKTKIKQKTWLKTLTIEFTILFPYTSFIKYSLCESP